MTELISYYEQNPLYRRMKLKYAINDDVLKQIGEVSQACLGAAMVCAVCMTTGNPPGPNNSVAMHLAMA